MRKLLVILVVLAAVLSLAGCAIPMATQVEVQVLDNRIVVVKPSNGRLPGGEAVIKIDNYATHAVNMVLAKTSLPAARLPTRLVDAVSPSADSRIVAMTSRVDKVGVTLAMGAFPNPLPRIALLHVYLEPGKRYLLFDSLRGGYKRGIALQLIPRSR